MRHLSAIALAAAVLVPVAAAAAPTAAKRKAPVASVRVIECKTGATPEDRSATFRGTMRRVHGTARMWMRFVLQERTGGKRYQTIKADGLGVWHKGRPGIRRFAFRQRVLALAEGTAYRVVVSYRWYDRHDALIRKTKRRSEACRQGGNLANLRVTRIGARPLAGVPGTVRYSVQVANRGKVAAESFGVSLRVDGDQVDIQTVDRLVPGELKRVSFVGPACASSVQAVADPANTVRESREGDNVLTTGCPTRA